MTASLDDRGLQIRARSRGDGPLREAVVDLFRAAAADWKNAGAALARGLREARHLGSAERRFVGDAVHDLIRFRRRLEHLVGRPEAPLLFDAWLDGAATGPATIDGATVGERLGLTHAYPDWLVERLLPRHGEVGTAALLAAMNHRAPLTVRANRIRGDRATLAERLLREEGIHSHGTSLARHGLILDSRRNVYDLAPLRDGSLEVQDEGSQLIVELCAVPPRGTVIDACAGAGGKSLALAAELDNRGRLIALDVSAYRLTELRRRARRAGVTNLQALDVAAGLPATLPLADRLLVDAPCSGSGTIRRHPETKWHLSPAEVDELAAKQLGILETYARFVAPGGRLIYATCSLLDEENDQVVDRFLAAQPRFQPVPAKEILGKERALAVGDGERLRLFPHRHDCDGFFAAVLRRG